MSAADVRPLTWLHLSDFHLREKNGWAQDVVLESMLADILARYTGAKCPDLLFLTGDIAFSGTEPQYKLAEEFIRKLCTGLNLSIERVFVIPGNHDINREISEDAFVGARASLNSPTDVDAFFEKENRRDVLFARQAAFRAFANRISPEVVYSAASYRHVRRVSIGSLRVRVLLLDSAWLAEGGETDAGRLLVGERQVLECTKAVTPEKGCVTFALMHHPTSSLREFEQVAIENLLMENADLCLRGHVHATDVRSSSGSRGQITTFTAGAAFQTRTTQNTYCWCALDIENGQVTQVTHRYYHAQRVWEASAPEPWLLASQPSSADVASVHRTLAACDVSYPCYISCLLADIQAEVPILLPTGRIAFVRFDAKIPSCDNNIGILVGRLRRHFFWREVYEEAWWLERMCKLGKAIEAALTATPGYASELDPRERACAALVGVEAAPDATPACTEIRQLIEAGAYQSARVALERWMPQDFLAAGERRELRRLEVLLLLAEGKPVLALANAEKIAVESERTSQDVAVAATCALNAGEHARAGDLLHEALDLGFPIAQAKTTARRIAGLTGDKRLAERVSQ